MNRWKFFLIILSALVMSGCSAVYSPLPVGESPYAIKSEDWDGTWINKDTYFSVKVVDGQKGVLRAAWMEWKDDEARLESHEVQLLQTGKWVFANVKVSEGDEKVLFVWAPFKRDGNAVVCWTPDVEKFKALGKAGKLPCREENDDIFLNDLTPEHLKIITSETECQLYDWRDPLVFIRMTGQAE
ncbi:MAG: hypothetical protein AB2L11_00465 [Syntrophobacteraceae bacterium]